MFVNDRYVLVADQPESWRTGLRLVYVGKHEVFVVPAGFRTDLASVPRVFTWLIPRYGIYTLAAILHDYLCRKRLGCLVCRVALVPGEPIPVEHHGHKVRPGLVAPVSLRDADGIFRRVMQELGTSHPRRWMMWAAVRVGHRMSDATGREWAQFLAVAPLSIAVLIVPVTLVQVWVWLFALVEWASRLWEGGRPLHG